MHYLAVMFDLDGTLADSLRDISVAINHVLAEMNLRPISLDRVRQITGRGLRWLVQNALDSDHQDLVEPVIRKMTDYYKVKPFLHTKPYDGIPELLDELTRRHIPLAVLSNKPDQTTTCVINHIFNRWRFTSVRGLRDEANPKPDPAAALEIAAELQIPATDWIFMGDSQIDMLTASAAGMLPVGVSWGFRNISELEESGADTIIHHPLELLKLMESGT